MPDRGANFVSIYYPHWYAALSSNDNAYYDAVGYSNRCPKIISNSSTYFGTDSSSNRRT